LRASVSVATICSHPNKYGLPQCDLSDDSEAKFCIELEKLSNKQLLIERMISKHFNHYHCYVLITDKLRTLFTSKLARMGNAIQSVGGTERAKLLDNWKGTKWLFELKELESLTTW